MRMARPNALMAGRGRRRRAACWPANALLRRHRRLSACASGRRAAGAYHPAKVKPIGLTRRNKYYHQKRAGGASAPVKWHFKPASINGHRNNRAGTSKHCLLLAIDQPRRVACSVSARVLPRKRKSYRHGEGGRSAAAEMMRPQSSHVVSLA